MHAFSHQPGAIHYPRMERQDLTQSQLGSFKFTPTDETDVKSSPRKYAAFLLQQEFAKNIAKHTSIPKSSEPRRSQTSRQKHPDRNKSHADSDSSSAIYCDSTAAFNDISRARVAGWKLAAETTPVTTSKQDSRRNTYPDQFEMFDAMQPEVPHFIPRHLRNSSDMNTTTSTASAFSQHVPGIDYYENTTAQSSLIRALQAEQEAHQATKALLEIERNARATLEAEMKRLEGHNRSLVGSVNMLKSVVQHNVKKQLDVAAAIPNHATVEAKVRETHNDARKSTANNSILYDSLKRQRRELDTPTLSASGLDHATEGTASKPTTDSGCQTLHDFDSLPRFGESSQASSHDVLDLAKARKPSQIDQLIDISSEHVDHPPLDVQKRGLLGDACNDRHGGRASLIVTTENIPRNDVATEAQGMLKSTIPDADHEDEQAAGALKHKDLNVHKDAWLKPGISIMAMPYDVVIDWMITPQTPIFQDTHAKVNCFKFQKTAGSLEDIFFRHPVRYMPEKSEKNLYRTVMIDFIPIGSTYKELLPFIRGGPLESIQLFDPVGVSNQFMTARVVFNYESDAQTLYRHGQCPGIELKGQPLRVWQVLQPTYPKNQQLESDIFEEGYTRVLLMENVPETSLHALPKKLESQMKAGVIVEIGQSYDGLPLIEFTSVAECVKAMRELLIDPGLGGTSFDFEQDPCEARYDSKH